MHLGTLSALPWLCMGDFNEVLDDSRGGIPTPSWRMRHFREAITVVGLADMGFRGFSFTWSDKRLEPLTIWHRLDRVLASADWSLQYSHAAVDHLVSRGSDHYPIMVCLEKILPGGETKKQKMFRFEAMWAKENDCEAVSKNCWREGTE